MCVLIAQPHGKVRVPNPTQQLRVFSLGSIGIRVMLLGEISADTPGTWLPVKPGPPTLRQQIELSCLESGGDRNPGETSLQPKTPDGMKNQGSAVKGPIRIVRKTNDPRAPRDEEPICQTHPAFIIN